MLLEEVSKGTLLAIGERGLRVMVRGFSRRGVGGHSSLYLSLHYQVQWSLLPYPCVISSQLFFIRGSTN